MGLKREDPRSDAQKASDEKMQGAIDDGTLPRAPEEVRRAARARAIFRHRLSRIAPDRVLPRIPRYDPAVLELERLAPP